MKSYTDLEVWKRGIQLLKEIYTVSKKFPNSERYELTSQIRKAAASVLANIAEGFGRFTYADKAHKYTIARGECTEVHAFLIIATELQYIDKAEVTKALNLSEEVGRMISGIIRANRNKS